MSHGTVEAHSAGSHPEVLHPNAVRAMAQRGIDISDRTAKPLSRFARMRFDQVITLCDRAREVCPEFPNHPTVVHWSIADPAADADSGAVTHSAFEQTARELESRIAFLLARIAEPMSHKKETPHA